MKKQGWCPGCTGSVAAVAPCAGLRALEVPNACSLQGPSEAQVPSASQCQHGPLVFLSLPFLSPCHGFIKIGAFLSREGICAWKYAGGGGKKKSVPLILSDILLYVSLNLSVAFCLLPFPVVLCKQCCLSAKDCWPKSGKQSVHAALKQI